MLWGHTLSRHHAGRSDVETQRCHGRGGSLRTWLRSREMASWLKCLRAPSQDRLLTSLETSQDLRSSEVVETRGMRSLARYISFPMLMGLISALPFQMRLSCQLGAVNHTESMQSALYTRVGYVNPQVVGAQFR